MRKADLWMLWVGGIIVAILLLTGCADRKQWTMKDLSNAIEREQKAQETY